MAFQYRALCLSVLAGVASSDSSNSTTSLRGAALAEEACRLAVKGEECYEHVYWAMVHGMKEHPERYGGLTQRSSFAEFQAYLHKSNHGNCPAPCLKPRCCGKSGCRPYNREYDPSTEQCCGEGEYIDRPTVCGKDLGCCAGQSMYTGTPQCFDRGRKQCCGVNYPLEAPVICSLDVACPKESYSWRQCPSADAAVAAASSSSNAESGKQLFLP